MRAIRAFRPLRKRESRVEKCKTCGHKTYYEVCPGCGKNMDCRNSKVQINIYTPKRSVNIATHSLKCLKQALPKEEYDAVMTLLGGKMGRARGLGKPNATQLKRIIKRAERSKKRAEKIMAEAQKELKAAKKK